MSSDKAAKRNKAFGVYGAIAGSGASIGYCSAVLTRDAASRGSVGTALLSTLVLSASLASAHLAQGAVAHAAVHGYTTAFASAAGIFALGAIIAGALFERGGQIDTSAQAALA